MNSFPIPVAHDAAGSLDKRQRGVLAIPTSYHGLNSGPAPAIVVAIVLGSVAGFLLTLWLVLACISLGGGYDLFGRRTVVEEDVITRRRQGPRREVEIIDGRENIGLRSRSGGVRSVREVREVSPTRVL